MYQISRRALMRALLPQSSEVRAVPPSIAIPGARHVDPTPHRATDGMEIAQSELNLF